MIDVRTDLIEIKAPKSTSCDLEEAIGPSVILEEESGRKVEIRKEEEGEKESEPKNLRLVLVESL